MAKRKTISVADTVSGINEMLKSSTCSDLMRLGMCSAAELILHSSGQYRGYRYLLASEVPQGELPGVNYEVNAQGNFVPCENYEERFYNTDRSRVQYFVS